MSVVAKRVFAPLAIISFCVVIAFVLFLLRPEASQVEAEERPLLVDVGEVVKQSIPITVRSQGNVVPRTQTSLVSEVSGQIVSVSPQFKPGAFFEANEVLLKIDDRNYRAELSRAEAAVASARSQLALEQGLAHVAYQDWLKHSREANRSPEADALAQRKPQLAEAQARLDSALADLARAQDNLERTSIRAPYTGMVRDKQVDIGQYVTVGTALARTFAVDYVEVRLPIPGDRVAYLELPDRDSTDFADVVLSARMGDQELQWRGKLVRNEGVIDERSRVLHAVVEVVDPYGLHSKRDAPLRVGTFVQAEISGRTIENLVVVPRRILRTGNQLWVIDSDNRLHNRRVSILRTDGDLVYVSSGLEEGEYITLTAMPNAIAGTSVRANSTVSTSSLLAPRETNGPSGDRAHLAGDKADGEPRG